jgi:tetratricopeptide (TPR) repeat protein
VMNIVSTSAVTLISMRWLYFPMIFLGPLVCLALTKLLKTRKEFAMIGLFLVLAYFGVYSYILNKDLWQNEEAFFPTEIHEFGNSFYAYGYAAEHMEKKEFEKAEKYFRIALEGYYNKDAAAHIEYSGLLVQLNRPLEALALLEKDNALPKRKTQRGQWYNNLGTAYFKLGKVDDAIESFEKSVSYHPTESLFWANLGGAYGSIRAYPKSADALMKGLRLDPKSVEIRRNLAITYMHLEKYQEAMDVLREIDPERFGEDQGLDSLLKKVKSRLCDGSLEHD